MPARWLEQGQQARAWLQQRPEPQTRLAEAQQRASRPPQAERLQDGSRLPMWAVPRPKREAWPPPVQPEDARRWRESAGAQRRPEIRHAARTTAERRRQRARDAAGAQCAGARASPRPPERRREQGAQRAWVWPQEQRARQKLWDALGARRRQAQRVGAARRGMRLPAGGSPEWPWRHRRASRHATSQSSAFPVRGEQACSRLRGL